MTWKDFLPKDLFFVSRNGLVVPRYIAKPVFSFMFLTTILLLILFVSMTTPFSSSGRIVLPESIHCQFQFMGAPGNFLVILYLGRDSLIWNTDMPIVDPDSPALPCELSRLFQDTAAWHRQIQVPFLQKSHFFNIGYLGRGNKLFLHADCGIPWGKVVSLLKSAQKAGIHDVCFLTEEQSCY